MPCEAEPVGKRDGKGSPDLPRSFVAGDLIISCEPWVWSFQYKYHKILCAYCFSPADNLRSCSNCKLYHYCDKQCQTLDWKNEHKRECEMLKTIQTKILLSGKDFDHECAQRGCSEFGCCTAEILMAKVINKIMNGGRKKLAGAEESLSATDILESLPYDKQYEGLFRRNDPAVGKLIFPLTAAQKIPNFYQLMRKVYYNALPILDQRTKIRVNAAAIYPQALHRHMTAVCWDTNVTMDLHGRTLVVHATEEIPKYTGLKDLRQNELIHHNFTMTLKERREGFENMYGHACKCRKCTKEYDAEINPLKCATRGCSERIPSDQRALQPCPQCGALNADRLKMLQQLMDRYHGVDVSKMNLDPAERPVADIGRLGSVLADLDKADILYPDAHFRFACGFDVVELLSQTGQFQKAWETCKDMVTCVRSIYPQYHLGRARCLLKAGGIPHIWAYQASEGEKKVFKALFERIMPTALDWLFEAAKIYGKLGGERSTWARETWRFITEYGPCQAKANGKLVTMIPPKWKRDWLWHSGEKSGL